MESAERTAGAEKMGEGIMRVEPWVRQVRRPRTRPKQWKRGGGQQRMSEGAKDILVPMKRALLIKLLKMLVVFIL